MRTATVEIYAFDELSDDAKARARNWWRAGFEYSWHDESLASVKAFCAHFGVRLTKWEIGAYSPYSYSTDADNSHFRGRKLRDFDREHNPTGFCLDYDLWSTFYDQFEKTGDAKHAFDMALDAGFCAWRDDIEYQLSDAGIDDSLEANAYEFYADGRPV
jgi:hypothetical protein